MTISTVPYALQNASHPASLFREAMSFPYASGGVGSSAEMVVTQQGTPNMSVILGAGRVMIPGTSVSPPAGQTFWTSQGIYYALNDAALTLAIAASNPTNPRIDVVYVQAQDSFYTGATNTAIAGVVTGTPAASPTVPAVPVNAIAIANVAVAANATTIVNANISRVIGTASLIGSIYAPADLTALAALTGMVAGNIAAVLEGGALFEYSGSAWVQQTPARFGTSGARDTAYAKASAAYLVVGATAIITTAVLVLMEYNGAGWQKRGLIKPTAAAVTTGSVVINDDGSVTVTFTGAGNVIFSNIFPTIAVYDTDCADVEVDLAGTAGASVSLRLCVGGAVDPSGANHDLYGPTYTQAGTPTNNTTLNAIQWTPIGGAIGLRLRWGVDHANAALSTTSFLSGRAWSTLGTAEVAQNLFMNHRLASAFDGFQMTVPAACVVTVKVKPRA